MYNEAKKLYDENFSLGYFGDSLNNKLILISLIALVSKKTNKTPLEIIESITKNSNKFTAKFIITLAIWSEELGYGCTNIDSCGLTSSKEIINKIKEILNIWVPF